MKQTDDRQGIYCASSSHTSRQTLAVRGSLPANASVQSLMPHLKNRIAGKPPPHILRCCETSSRQEQSDTALGRNQMNRLAIASHTLSIFPSFSPARHMRPLRIR